MPLSKTFLAAVTCAALIACGSSTTSDVEDDGTGGDGGSTTSTGGTGGGGGGGGGSDACEGFDSELSTQTVSVELTNDAAVDRYAMITAVECDPFLVERLGQSGYESVLQSVGFQCGCECPGPPAAGPSQLTRIPAGASLTLTWDAREVDTCVTVEDCMETYGFEGTANITNGFRVPVASGDYRLTFKLYETLPTECIQVDGDAYQCSPSFDTPSCDGDLTAVADLSLPDSGDVTVPVSVP